MQVSSNNHVKFLKKKLYKKYLKHHLLPRMLPSTHVTFSSSSQWPRAEMPRPTWLQPWDVHRCFFEDNEKSPCALSRIARCAGWHEFLLPWGKRMVLIVLLSVHIFSWAFLLQFLTYPIHPRDIQCVIIIIIIIIIL